MRVLVILNLVQRLLLVEAAETRVAAEDQEGELLIETAERILDKLRGHLSRKIGAEGFRTLLARSLTLTKAQYPYLSEVKVAADGSLSGLREAAESVKAADAAQEGEAQSVSAEGTAALVAQLLELLITFIGEELTRRIVSTIWLDFIWGNDLIGNNATNGEKKI